MSIRRKPEPNRGSRISRLKSAECLTATDSELIEVEIRQGVAMLSKRMPHEEVARYFMVLADCLRTQRHKMTRRADA